MALTAAAVKNARPGEKPYKLTDERGLYLFATTTGARSWRLKYRFGGKERVMTFGLFPEVSLAEARDCRDEARKHLRANRDPKMEADKEKRAALAAAGATFEVVATEWHEAERSRWSPRHAVVVMSAFKRDVFPDLGKLPVADIDGPTVLKVLRKIEKRGSIETAKRVMGYISGAFERAKAEHLVQHNPTTGLIRALKPTPRGAKQPALTTVPELLALQKAVDVAQAGPITKLASRLLALTVVRVGVLRAMTWDEIHGIDWNDVDAPCPTAIWRIPADRMKLEVAEKGDAAYDHNVPLTEHAVAVLRAMRRLTGRCRFVFPGHHSTSSPMSDGAVSTLYRRLGYERRHVPHGWRAAFSTIMNERAVRLDRDLDRLAIDLMLAHVPNGMSASEFAYNRARYEDRRRELAQAWGDLITAGLEPPASLLPR